MKVLHKSNLSILGDICTMIRHSFLRELGSAKAVTSLEKTGNKTWDITLCCDLSVYLFKRLIEIPAVTNGRQILQNKQTNNSLLNHETLKFQNLLWE